MTSGSKSLAMLRTVYILLLPAFYREVQAQHVKVRPEVTGVLGNDVTLPCQLIQGQKLTNISQTQWAFNETKEGEPAPIIVSNNVFGVSIESPKFGNRLDIVDKSLTIKGVELSDAGFYICSVTTFPAGSFKATTQLVVHKQLPLSSGVVAAIVIAVLLFLVIMAVITYLLFFRRSNSSTRPPGGVHVSVSKSSGGDLDIVYADVKHKPSRGVNPSSSDKQTDAKHADDVTYAEVSVLRQQPKSDVEMWI
ncbi:nectin-3-like protein [Aulostomus maculatus]